MNHTMNLHTRAGPFVKGAEFSPNEIGYIVNSGDASHETQPVSFTLTS